MTYIKSTLRFCEINYFLPAIESLIHITRCITFAKN